MAYTVQNLVHAVSVFYSSEHRDRAEAHKWLTAAQSCPEAWSFVWELLQSQKGTEIQFFAATTLHTKLQGCWAEVPPDKYDELKSRILEAIALFSRGPKIVLNRLCISLAAFLLQQGGRGILETVEPLLTSQNAAIILEILSVVPEEFNSMTMSANSRSVVRNNLQQLTPQILDLVTKHLHIDTQRQIMCQEEWCHQVSVWQSSCQCAAVWLELGGTVPVQCSSVLTAALQVLHAVYWGQTQNNLEERKELSSSEFETCESALSVASAALTQPDVGKHSASCLPLIRLLLDAVEPLLQAEDIIHSSNDELVAAIYGAIVGVGECHAQWIASALSEEEASVQTRLRAAGGDEKQMQMKKEAGQCARDLTRLILRCSDAPGVYPTQETHSQLAFGFWYILQDEALRDIPGTIGEGCYKKIALRAWYEQLSNALLRKSTLLTPPATYSSEDAELMRCYRQDIADIFVHCYTVLGPSLLQQLGTLLERLSAAVSNEQREPLVTAQLEAVLHAFHALGEAAGASDPSTPTLLLNTLLVLPYHAVHHQLLITALDCFSAYAEWLGSDDAGEEASALVGGALRVSCGALAVPSAAPRAALALRSLTKDCKSQLPPHAVTLLTAIQSCQSSLGGALGVKVLSAAGSAAASLPPSTAAPHVATLTAPLLNVLQNTQRTQLSNSDIDECSCALWQAAALLTGVCGAGAEHAQTPLALLLPVLPHSARHSQLAEPLFALIKLIITNLLNECIPLLPDLINILNIGLKGEPHPAAIDVAKLMSMMFPEICGNVLSVATRAVVRECQIVAEKGSSLSDLSPLLDTTYSALTAAAIKKPQLLDHMQNDMQRIIQIGIFAMSLPEQGPCRASCCFFSQLAKVRPSCLIEQGPTIVQRALHCIGILTPRSHIDPFAEIFLGLGRIQWEEVSLENRNQGPTGDAVRGPGLLSLWLRDSLQHPGFPSEQATVQVKDKFMKAVIKHHGHKRRLIEAIREFALACRGLLGEYGQMTQASLLS